MRKNLFVYLFGVLCSLALFTACSDDDGNKGNGGSEDGGGQPVSLQETVVGTYEGDLRVVLPELNLDNTQTRRIFVKADGAENVQLVLKDFSIEVAGAPVPVGDIEVSGIALEGDATAVQLKETTVTILHPDLGELPVTVSGDIASGKANLSIKVVWSDLNIDVTFTGNRISHEVFDEDYGKMFAGYYPRTENGFTCDYTEEGFELKYPTDGITLVSDTYSKLSFAADWTGAKVLSVSFPVKPEFGDVSDQYKYQKISMDATIQKNADGTYSIQEYKGNIEALEGQREAIGYTISGTINDNRELKLNINLKSETYDVNYTFVSGLQKDGSDLLGVTFDKDILVGDPVVKTTVLGGNWCLLYAKAGTTAADLTCIPTFEVSDGAKVVYNGALYEGAALDFSVNQVIKVISEKDYIANGVDAAGTEYNLSLGVLDFSTALDNWEAKGNVNDADMVYYEPVLGWKTSNPGVEYLKSMSFITKYDKTKPYAVTECEGVSGKAAKLTTLNSGGSMLSMVPVVTSGSLFNGSFVTEISNTLLSTLFGQPCEKEPKSFSGSYTYKAGEDYYVCKDPANANKAEIDETKKDLPAMNAVLYEVADYSEFLNGTNLLTSDKVVAIASVDGTEQEAWTSFNVDFMWKEGKSWDASKKYKLAIVCSSSKDGDKFSGAPGSVLCVDDLKVSF